MVQIASGSLVLCVHELERLAREGVDFDEAVACANTFLERTKILFALSSFDNLIKNGRMGKMTGFLARALGMWGIGTASEEGTIVVEGKARGTKKAVRELINRMKERGFAGGRVAISHCDNLAVAQTLKETSCGCDVIPRLRLFLPGALQLLCRTWRPHHRFLGNASGKSSCFSVVLCPGASNRVSEK